MEKLTTGWRRPMQVISRKRATNYSALFRKTTYKDKASYGSLALCILDCNRTATAQQKHSNSTATALQQRCNSTAITLQQHCKSTATAQCFVLLNEILGF